MKPAPAISVLTINDDSGKAIRLYARGAADAVALAFLRPFHHAHRHRLDAGEARLGGDLDHVVEFVVVTFAGALHEPGIDFGAELDFTHGMCCWWLRSERIRTCGDENGI